MYYQVVKKQENLLLWNKKAEIILGLCFLGVIIGYVT